jgi:signal transduction histidine kinase
MPHTERTYRLLIVDDDETDRRLYGWLLARQAPGAFEIEQARDGASGIAALRAGKFDCLLLDFSLPDVTGLEFLVEAVVEGELPCAVVLITGHGNEAIAVEAMKLGVQDYLVKDHVNEGRLWRAIVRAVSQRELRSRLTTSMRALTAANATLEQEVAAHEKTEVELRGAKQAAEQADQAKTRFVAMVTHELRTPLNGILGYAQLLRIEGGLTARQNARVGAMMHAGRHLFAMIERVLDFASIEAGGIQLHPVALSVRDLTEGCIAFVGPSAVERGLSLRLISSHDAPRQIVTDPDRLRQVLLNLLGNAVKFTVSGGVELRVLATDPPGGLRMEIADTGPGIEGNFRDRLFQDFERLDAPTSIEGAGLGLAISARFVGLMGGSIGHLQNPGGGSIFWLELAAEEALPAPTAAPEADERPFSGGHVLLVDDIAMNRDVIGAFLRAAGYDVALAENGEDAVRAASAQAFDLILMDIRMPEMDGLEATRRIRVLPEPYGQVPILALTAYFFPDQIAQCQAAGMNGHVAKPVDYDTLIRAVSAAIARSPPAWVADGEAIYEDEPEAQSPLRLERGVLDRLLGLLPPDEAAANLRSLHVCNEEMLRLMERPMDEAADPAAARCALAEHARGLASIAGMFGFAALSVASSRYQQAIEADLPASRILAPQMEGEIRAALVLLNTLMRESRMQTASS